MPLKNFALATMLITGLCAADAPLSYAQMTAFSELPAQSNAAPTTSVTQATAATLDTVASSSHSEQVALTSAQNHMLVVISSTAHTQELAQKDAERLKTDFVYGLFKEIGLKPTTVSSSVESKINPDNSYTYKLTMTGYVLATPQYINSAVDANHPPSTPHDADRFLIKNLSVSDVNGTRRKGPYHDIKIVISSDAPK